ncbi:centrosomal protein of 104 kDa isoform X3 [Pogoniulus pusillus]|uniref:centrosomal protein of 104 kDa isoform X3 n=1 Tax=Pogoniulus pusillus TaxID=488313 RepID=UPI0030B965D7
MIFEVTDWQVPSNPNIRPFCDLTLSSGDEMDRNVSSLVVSQSSFIVLLGIILSLEHCIAHAGCRMPHKIGFIVVSSSGHEDGFSAKELMVHAPTVNGWRSPRLCQYPQEIVLQLVERCRIRKLQLLAHQYMISSKVEFYISESLPEYFAPYQAERFHRLGYVPLSDNEKTDFEARELKSVYVDAVGQYLKLIFHKNYVNKYNLYDQVALVAVNIIGDPADCSHGSNHTPSRERLIDHYLGVRSDDPALDGSYLGKSDSISPLDDLAFDMYQDPEVAQIIRRLDERKREAVHRERYDQAKQLKQAIADLQKVGERLGRYEVEKRCAVEKEDYDLAKSKKQQMEAFRLQVYQQLQLHDLLDAELLVRKPPELPLEPLVHSDSPQHSKAAASPPAEHREPCREEPWAAEPVLEEKPAAPTAAQPLVAHQSPPPHPETRATTPQEGLPREKVELLPYDERPLPAACKQPQAVTYLEPERAEEAASASPVSGIAGEPEPLSEKALREASPAVEVFGEALVSGAYSKTWSYREDALLAVYKRLMEMSVNTPKDDLKNMLRAAIFLVRRAIKDIVSSVFQASLKLLKMIITQYIPKHKLGKVETSHCVERTLPNLLARTGDSSARLRQLASDFIQELALCAEVKPLQVVPAHLVQPLKPNCPPHLAMSQVELVERLLKEMGTANSGFAISSVMEEPEFDLQKPRNQGYQSSRSPQPAAAPGLPDDHSSVASYLDNLCIFCGERDESFTEDGLDLHYWKHCPMLTRCEHCKQTVEIAGLTEHLLADCHRRDSFGRCPRCSEAIPAEALSRHLRSKTCNPAKPEAVANHCPLCHDNFAPGEEAWKSHLMGRDGCRMNKRRVAPMNKTLLLQPGRAAGRKPGAAGAKLQPPALASKIPTPRGGPNKSSGKTYSKQCQEKYFCLKNL